MGGQKPSMSDPPLSPALGNLSLADSLLKRRSIRKFASKPINPAAIESAIAAACLAPSPHGSSPWRFCVLSSVQSRKNLAEKMGLDFLRDMEKEGVSENERNKRYYGSIRLITEAPALILAALSYTRLDDYDDPGIQANEYMMAEHSLGAALQNLMLALAAEGIGTVWRCAPLFCSETAREALDLPADWVPRSLILAGYPDSTPPPKEIAQPEILIR